MTSIGHYCHRHSENTQKHMHRHAYTRISLKQRTDCPRFVYTLESLLTCAWEQPQEDGRSSVNKQRTLTKTLHSPERCFRAHVENNGHFWAQAWHANVPQQTTFFQPAAWLSSHERTAIQHGVTFSQKKHVWIWKVHREPWVVNVEHWYGGMLSSVVWHSLPLSHWAPVKPYVHTHLLGATHLPPLRQPFSQTAGDENRDQQTMRRHKDCNVSHNISVSCLNVFLVKCL